MDKLKSPEKESGSRRNLKRPRVDSVQDFPQAETEQKSPYSHRLSLSGPMYGGSSKHGRLGGGAGRGAGAGKLGRASFPPPHRSSAPAANRLSLGGSNNRRGGRTSAPGTSASAAPAVEEKFSLVSGNNPVAFSMIIRLVPDLVKEIRRVEAQGGTPRIKFDSLSNNPNNPNGNVILSQGCGPIVPQLQPSACHDLHEDVGTLPRGTRPPLPSQVYVGGSFSKTAVEKCGVLPCLKDKVVKQIVKDAFGGVGVHSKGCKHMMRSSTEAAVVLPCLKDKGGKQIVEDAFDGVAVHSKGRKHVMWSSTEAAVVLPCLKDKGGKQIVKDAFDGFGVHSKGHKHMMRSSTKAAVVLPCLKDKRGKQIVKDAFDGVGVHSKGRKHMMRSSTKATVENSGVLPNVKDKGKQIVKDAESEDCDHDVNRVPRRTLPLHSQVDSVGGRRYEVGSSSKATAGGKSWAFVKNKKWKQCDDGNSLCVESEFERKAVLRVNKALSQFQEEVTRLRDHSFKLEGNAVYITAANRMKRFFKWVNTNKGLGNIPGLKIGDKFSVRAELCVIGLHGVFEPGIDYMEDREGKMIAKAIVESGRYANKWMPPDLLLYYGEVENPAVSRKDEKHQKAKLRNRALMNCFPATPVRVIRKYKIAGESGYVYEGLYTVVDYWSDTRIDGIREFKFLMSRIPGQPNVTLGRS